MKKTLAILTILFSNLTFASELISIQSPYTPTHSGYAPMLRIIDEANKSQNKYRFVMESKPGGEQIIAVKQMEESPQNRMAIVAAKYVEHVKSGKLNRDNHVAIHALGDACWAVITSVGDEKTGLDSLRGFKDLTVGGPGIGNATHITAIQLGEKYKFNPRYIPFKSSYDALLLAAGDGSINMVLERVESYQQLREKSSRLKLLAMSCPNRHHLYPNVKTLQEYGIDAVYVFNVMIADKSMPENKRAEIAAIFERATVAVGEDYLKSTSWAAPLFSKTSTETYFNNRFRQFDNMLTKYSRSINESISN